ncbi:MAG: hypothetical protein QOG09_1808 [Solirubrobacterales bacterium]|jgi:hypothetical protein|nr:hypothetical protein [Solirubrobacterales bacterium]MDX6651867.1 hypothetical protein [Solirubrobacterales bacterium]MDX6663706.1 hypothetical protein [Solirubrobacterales bacterium]
MTTSDVGGGQTRVEALLAEALRPIEPPERLSGRVETTLSAVAEAAAEELHAWADELTESEAESLRDPRNWVRPVVAVAAGSVAGGALLLFEMRRRRKPSGLRAFADDIVSRFET